MNDFIQFELWKDCNNNCKFCFNQKQKDIDKLKSIAFIRKCIQNIDFTQVKQIGLIGGEFFDNQLSDKKVFDNFYLLIDDLCKLLQNCKIKKLYVTTSLIYDNTTHLKKFLSFIKDRQCQDKLLLCTSYDTIGRFHTSHSLEIWKNNMSMLSAEYTDVKKHIEIILTQDFINSVKSNKLDISQLSEIYDSHIDYLEPFVPVSFSDKNEFIKEFPDFLPNRKDFIDFVIEYCINTKSIDLSMLFSKKLRSDVLYYIKDKKHYCISDRHCNDNTCGLEENGKTPFFGYADSDIQMCEDVRRLYETI